MLSVAEPVFSVPGSGSEASDEVEASVGGKELTASVSERAVEFDGVSLFAFCPQEAKDKVNSTAVKRLIIFFMVVTSFLCLNRRLGYKIIRGYIRFT